ncbi:MAG TPA: hypothetical protein VNF07_04170 [Acidimicrobiales bacterium]|nr:hypothetical protein [Acidimicrobiales bacterium]
MSGPTAPSPDASATGGPDEGPAVSVLPDVSGIDRTFDYTVPGPTPAAGTLVRVPLGGRRVRGWVVEALGRRPTEGLRPLERVLSIGPAPELVGLARYGAWRYAGRLRPFLLAGSPLRQVAAAAPPPPPAAALRRGPIGDALRELVESALERPSAVLRLPPSGSRLAVVEEVIARVGPEVLVLCPSLADVAVLRGHLERAGHRVAAHPEDFALAAGGGRVVLGSRAAVFAPAPRLAAIVVLDAHAEAYREERAPTWDATVLAVERARRAEVPCLLVTPAPTATLLSGSPPLTLPPHEERAEWPRVEVVDRRGDDPRAGLFSGALSGTVRRALETDPGRPVVAVLNRTGRARLLSCATCGELARCEHCGAALAQRRLPDPGTAAELSCPRCGASRPVVCAECGARRMRLLRVGAARAAEELAALVRLPVGEVSGPRSPLPEAPVLVGTEAVLHRVRRAALVVFLDFDQELLAARYRAAEQAMALLVLAGRLVGPRSATGAPGRRVVVQTRLPEDEVLAAAVNGTPGALAEAELARRRQLALPPFGALALLSGERAPALAAELVAAGLEVSEREPATLLVRGPDPAHLADALRAVVPLEAGLRVEVDPISV